MDSKIVNITKGFMLPEFRRNGLFKLIFSTVLLECHAKGFEIAIAAYAPSVKSRNFTQRLGFEETDQLIDCLVPPYEKTQIIPIICNLKSKYFHYLQEFNEVKSELLSKNFKLRFDNFYEYW